MRAPSKASAEDSRSAAQRVASNTALRAGADLVSRLAAFAPFIAIAQVYGPNTLGEYAFALALSSLLWTIVGFGMDRLALRDIARDRSAAETLVGDVVVLKLALGAGGVAVAASLLAVGGVSESVLVLVCILGAALLADLVAAGAVAVFQAHERMGFYVAAHLPFGLGGPALALLVIAVDGTIVHVALVRLAMSLLALGTSFGLLRRHFVRPRYRLLPGTWPALLRRAAPFGAQEMFGQLIFRANTILAGVLASTLVVGAYNAGFRLLEATLFIVWSVGGSVLPLYAYTQRGGTAGLERVFEGSVKFVLVLMLPISLVLAICARPIVGLVYGLPEYDATVDVLYWLAPAITLYAVGHLAGVLVLVHRRGRVTIAVSGLVAVFNVLLCLLLIPAFEAQGAAAATLASEALLAGLALGFARAVVGPLRWRRIFLRPFLAAAAMAAAMVPFADSLPWALPVGAATYVLALVVLEGRASSGDLAVVRAVLTARRSTNELAGADTERFPPGP